MIFRRFFFIVHFLVFFIPFSLFGQQIKHLGAYDGVKSGAVRAFAKDTLGYMWIGTAQGLNRYSGYNFKNYNKYTTHGIEDIISKNGNLFVLGSKGELLQYQYEQDHFKSLLNLKSRNFLCFEQINDNTIIIGLKSGLLIYDFKSKKLSKVLYPKTFFNRQIHVKQNKVYVASTKGINVYDFFEKNNQLVKHNTLLKNIETLDFDFDKQNRIWAGTYQKGLFVIDNEKVNKVPLFDKRIKTTTIRSIVFDKDDKALLALEGLGLLTMNENFKVVNKIKYNPNSLNSLSQKSIYKIFVDNDNIYWLGLREVGIDLIFPRDNAFKNISYVPYKSNSIPNNYIRSIYFEESGKRNKIIQLTGNAKEILNDLNETFDLVFIDADKENYIEYFKLVSERLNNNGIIISDNVLWSGKVLDPSSENDEETNALVHFNKLLNEDKRFETVILPLRDGLSISRLI